MAVRARTLTKWMMAGSLIGVNLAGCGKTPDPAGTPPSGGPPSLAIVNDPGKPAKPAEVDFNLRFDDAVTTDVLEGHHLPPDMTYAGKKAGPLRVAVEKAWPGIVLTDSAKRPVPQLMQFETSEGSFEITLRPELAPSHVRNFLALAKVGFYDGLVFERNVHQETEGAGVKSRLDLLIGGCPAGTGEDGYGHLGYFLLAEIQPDQKHEVGTVGFWHEEDPDSAGTRFYVTLGPAPALDGKFTVVGKVTRGLDTLKRIGSQPVRSTDLESLDSEKPVVPAVIRKVTVSPTGMEK